MKKWTLAVLVLAACALSPLLAPPAWAQNGAFPDLCVILVVYLAAVSTPERAAVAGMLLGLAVAPWTPEPLGQHAFLLGALGWGAGHLGRALHKERLDLQMAVVLVGVFALRLTEVGIAEISLGRAAAVAGIAAWPMGSPPAGDAGEVASALAEVPGFSMLRVVRSAGLSAVASAALAPVAFALFAWSRTLAPLERRRRGHV